VTGKPVGEDLREGKATPLLAIAHERAGKHACALLERVGASDLADDEVEALRELLVSTGARAETEGRIETLVAESVTALGAAPITDEARAALTELAEYVGHRDR
jgi:geranylgeranyl diphosphate synthase, type I